MWLNLGRVRIELYSKSSNELLLNLEPVQFWIGSHMSIHISDGSIEFSSCFEFTKILQDKIKPVDEVRQLLADGGGCGALPVGPAHHSDICVLCGFLL